MPIRKTVLNDKVITSQELINFIRHCVGQRGAFKGVSDSLAKSGLDELAHDAGNALYRPTDGVVVLDMSSKKLQTICRDIIGTLEDYQDLENIMAIEPDVARKFIQQIDERNDYEIN